MILSKLYIENFGLFKGKNVFDLEPSKNKPIILFGGKNGSGKTTLFEAIRLCLYGIGFRGTRIFSADYDQYLKDRLHKNSVVDNKMSVALEILYSRSGKLDRYKVIRSWKFIDDGIHENLEILRNEKIVNDIEKDQWQSFITELIPHGISKLFFFDGEKIQNLANNGENLYLMDSFTSLLGLDVVERLKADLRIYTVRETKNTPNFQLEGDLKRFEKERTQLENELEEVYQARASAQSSIDNIEARIQKQEQRIASEGGGFANKIDELKYNVNKLNLEIAATEKELRELAESLLPFSIVPDLCLSLKKRITAEAEYQYDNAIKSKLKKNYSKFVKDIASSDVWNKSSIRSDSERKKIIENVIEHFVNSVSGNNADKILHYFSMPEQRTILKWIEMALNETPNRVAELTRKLEKLTRERQSIEGAILKVPSDETLAPLVRELNDLHKELGQLQTKKHQYDEAISHINFKIKESGRNMKNIMDKLGQNKSLSRRLELTSKVQTVLDEYSEKLKQEKTKEFSDVLLQCFNHLYRKKKFITKVDIDPKNFSIILHARNSPLQRDGLSAGEKQIYAIAILWALARTSGKQLPFIIDTPLGRLDSEHRENLIGNFFHRTGKQVIIFSTDTEIDKKYFKVLNPYVTKTYHLQYDNEKGVTLTTNNYFWKTKEVVKNEL